jgi:hypothetical protein
MRDSGYSVTYVRKNDTAALTCPHCGQWRLISADPFRTKADIVILDVSVIGLTFSSLYIPSLKVEDMLRIEFTLDDMQQNEVMRDVVVRNVWQKRVGCEYLAPGRSFEGPLGFYVMS